MSLSFRDAFRLSIANIIAHKGRSSIAVLSVTILFSLLMTLNFLMNGLEKTALSLDTGRTGEKVYVQASVNHFDRWQNRTDEEEIKTLLSNEINDETNLPITFKPIISEQDVALINEHAKEFNGEIVGETWFVQLKVPYNVITLSAASDLIDVDLAQVPEDKIPVLTSRDMSELTSYQELNEHFEEVFYSVGTLPNVKRFDDPENPGRTVGWPVLENNNILNSLMKNIDGGLDYGFMIIDDGSDKIDRFLYNEAKRTLSESDWINLSQLRGQLVIRFSNVYDAIAFASPQSFMGITLYENSDKISITDLFSGVLATASGFNTLRGLIALLEIVFLIVAIVIATTTFKHLLAQDANTIALYRSMGATTKDLYLIYFLYILELCLMAVVMCIGIAFLLVGVVAMMNGEAIGLKLQTYYQLDEIPKVYFYSFDQYFWLTILAILMVAPLTLGFSSRCFSDTYVGKRLKEDH